MKTSQVSATISELKTAASTVWAIASESGQSFEAYLASREQRFLSRFPAKLPRWAREYLLGYEQALYGANTRRMVWVHVWEGKAYLSFGDLPDAAVQFAREGKGYPESAHYWPSPKLVNGCDVSSLRRWS